MKRFLLIITVIGLTTLSAHATYEVKYNNAGTIINSTPSQFGSNAAFTPRNRAIQGAKNRYIKHQDQLYNGLENRNQVNININTPTNNANNDSNSTITTDRTKRTFAKDKFLKDKVEEENE